MAMLPSDSSHQVECSPYRTTHGRNEGAGNLGASWYFSRKELEENSPSRRDGMDLKKESSLRKSYCTYIQELGMKLKVPQCTIATAMVFCHRFFLRQSHVKNDRRTIATVCMFLAGKVEETPRPLKDVILVSYELIHKKDPAAGQRIKQREIYDQQKELILLGERVVLATLGFDLNVHHPYKPLVEAIKKFNVAQSSLAQVAWNFVNDGLRTSLCLQFKPHHVAAGALYLAAKFLKVKLPSDGDKVWYLEFGVTPRQLEEVSNQILEMYEQNRAAQSQPSHGNEAGGSSASVPNQQVSKKAHGSSEEPPAYGHHQASKQLNSNHSTPTGAPVHNVVEQSNADKSQRILQTDNGDHVSNKTTDSQSGVEQSNPDKQVESQKVIQNDIADHGSNKITNSQSGVEQSNPDNQVGSQKVLQNDGDRGSNKITNSQTDVERSNPGKQVGSHNVLQNDNGGDHGSNKTTNNQSGDEVDAVTKDSLHADREALPETVMEEQKPVPSHGPSNETGDVTLINNDGPSVSSSMMDAMNKIDKDKVKAALEKRRKLKGDVARKVDLMDDDDLLESEIEHGVELAFEDEGIKQERSDTCPQSTMRHNHDQKAAEDTDNGHRGEQNMPEIARGQVSDGQ